jgi:hypothetical protein
MNARLSRNELFQPGCIVTDVCEPGKYLYLILAKHNAHALFPFSPDMELMVIYDGANTHLAGTICHCYENNYGTLQLFNER